MAATLWVSVAAFTFLFLALFSRRLDIEVGRAHLETEREAPQAQGART